MIPFFRAPLTGPKVFAIFASFFGTIIAVNIVLAWSAISTFPGIEVRNSYVASQTFDDDRAAQLALGWQVEAGVEGDQLQIRITDSAGQPVEVASIAGIFGRATMAREDQRPDFTFDGTTYRALITPAYGNWYFRLEAVAADGTPFKQRLPIFISAGGAQ